MLVTFLLCFALATITQSFSALVDPTQNRITLTSAVLQISYDGTLFHGWSAANDGARTKNVITQGPHRNEPYRKRRSRRNKNRPYISQGKVRSVQGTISSVLAKLYGDVPLSCVHVEGCSRTDRGVHARQMIAQIYCTDKTNNDDGTALLLKPGKELQNPRSPSDLNFKPLPFGSDLAKLTFTLNKMLPPDVRVVTASPSPVLKWVAKANQFHPSLDAMQKTYQYTFSVGELHNPLSSR